jgi:hypothetical protein
MTFTDTDRRALSFNIPPAGADYLRLDVSVVHVDLLRAEMTTRISVHLAGRLAQDDTTPSSDLKIVLNTISGTQEFFFAKGQRINPIEAVFPLDGDVNLYPFDRYDGVLWIFATISETSKEDPNLRLAQAHTVVPDELVNSPQLPVSATVLKQTVQADTMTTFVASVPGLTFQGSQPIRSAQTFKGLTGIKVALKRSRHVLVISVITMLMMAGLSAGLVIMVLRVIGGARNMTSFQIPMATSLIFGLPALRNIQPGVPPPGTFGDTIIFIWAEVIAAAAAIALIVHWLLNPSRMTSLPPD